MENVIQVYRSLHPRLKANVKSDGNLLFRLPNITKIVVTRDGIPLDFSKMSTQ